MTSFTTNIPVARPDEVFATKSLYIADTAPNKMNLGIGAYRTDEGQPYVLESVKKAIMEIDYDPTTNHEYLPISGLAPFRTAAAKLILGPEYENLKDKVCTVQSISGTGAIRLTAEFIKDHLSNTAVYGPVPTWRNHVKIFRRAGIDMRKYRYWDYTNKCLDLNGILEDMNNAPKNSIFIFHACAHNPTGMDPTHDEWYQILEAFKTNEHIPIFDCAYQGFASGHLDVDAWAIQMFARENVEFFVCQSFAKNMGLYAQRIGALHVVCQNSNGAIAMKSQLETIIRPMYSNPPKFGALIVTKILSDESLRNLWYEEMSTMSNRIKLMRVGLRTRLEELKVPGDWSHITTQIGMFSYTGLTRTQCRAMIDKHHIHMMLDGRISCAGLTSSGIEHLSQAILDVVTTIPADQ